MNRNRFVLSIAVGLCVALLPGCGGAFSSFSYHNGTPTISQLTANGQAKPSPIPASSTVVLVANAHDPDGDALNYQWQAESGTITPSTSSPFLATLAVPATQGPDTVTVTVDDGRNGVATRSITLNIAPVAASPSAIIAPSPVTLAEGANQLLSVTVTGGTAPFTYVFLATAGTVTPNTNPALSNVATYTAPMTAGPQTVYCIVTDSTGLTAVATDQITVTGP